MGLNKEDLTGMVRIDDFVPVPEEWELKGFREVKSKKGETFIVLEYARPNEPDISLFGHSVEKRDGRFYVRADHAARQAEQARKTA